MKFNFLLLKIIFFTHLASMSFAQLPEHRGMYVDGFVSQILVNKQETDKLLDFIESNHFNALTLYELHLIDFENVRQVRELSRFIRNARKIIPAKIILSFLSLGIITPIKGVRD